MSKIKILFFLFSFTLLGCQDLLERSLKDQLSTGTVYKTDLDIRFALNALYRNVQGHPAHQGNPRRSEYLYNVLTDDAINRADAYGTTLVITPTLVNAEDDYANRYAKIRQINEFLVRIPQAEENIEPSLYQRYIAEARFLRALEYDRIQFAFGDIPLITKPLQPEDVPPRNNRKDVFDWITKELTEVAGVLPWPSEYSSGDDQFRASKGAALTLKARHLLNGLHWYPDKDYLYREALDAASTVYNSGEYSLDPGERGFHQLFLNNSRYGSKGTIYTVLYDREFKGHTYPRLAPKGLYSGIVGRSNGNFPGVTDVLVESFQMLSTGKDITEPDSGYDPSNPWNDRDPRLDITVLREGEVAPTTGAQGTAGPYTMFATHPKRIAGDTILGEDVRVVNTDIIVPAGTQLTISSRDKADKGGINRTGYHFQKYLTWLHDDNSSADESYHILRFAEVILLYAEAALGIGDLARAESLVSEVRARVGMPDVATSYGRPVDIEIILNERRFEFATEGPHRWYDIIRHNLGPEVFADSQAARGIPWGDGGKPDPRVEEGSLDDSKKRNIYTRQYDPSTYNPWPFPQAAVRDNPKLLEPPVPFVEDEM